MLKLTFIWIVLISRIKNVDCCWKRTKLSTLMFFDISIIRVGIKDFYKNNSKGYLTTADKKIMHRIKNLKRPLRLFYYRLFCDSVIGKYEYFLKPKIFL